MQGAVVDGAVILQDIKDAPDGRRYAVGDEFLDDGVGTSQFSGVTLLEVETMTEAERAELDEARLLYNGGALESASIGGEGGAERIEPELRAWASAVDPVETREVIARVSHAPGYVPITLLIEREIALGSIQTVGDYDRVRRQLVDAQRDANARWLAEVVPEIEAAGGVVLSTCQYTPCLSLEVAAGDLDTVASVDGVKRLDLVREGIENEIRGREVADGSQITQFVDHPSDWAGWPSGFSVKAGVLEKGGFDVNHVGYLNAGGSYTRIVWTRRCSGGTCSDVPSYAPLSSHANAVAGLVLGDLTDGQDSTYTNAYDRIDRSGYGREAAAYFWGASTNTDTKDALDDIVDSGVALVNLSVGFGGDSACDGESVLSKDVNDIFDAGSLLIFAAGRGGHASANDCNVHNPGAAMGAFTVSSHGKDESTGTENDVRFGVIAGFAPRGGQAVEGKGRSIIDLTANACRKYMFDGAGAYGWEDCGTSYSAPTVAGATIDLIDSYKETYSNAIDDPLALSANLLLFGDRAAEPGGKMTSGFSNLWGAGRLKMRMYNSAGLDGPAEYGSQVTCIDHNETAYVNLYSGANVPLGVDAIKAVLTWYDRRHEDGTAIDNIDLRLQYYNSIYGWLNVESSLSEDDEKERVFYDPSGFFSAAKWRLAIIGTNVTADGAGCGTNSMRVRYAWFLEDSDRDDSDGPGTEIDPE